MLALGPEAFKGLPVWWSAQEQAELLQGSPLLEAVRQQQSDLEADLQLVQARVPGLADVAWEDFRWAMAVVGSRSFTLSPPQAPEVGGMVQGASDEVECMVPLMDMINHRRPRQTTYGLHPSTTSSRSSTSSSSSNSSSTSFSDAPGTATFIAKTLEPVSSGDEVWDTYGAKSNDVLLRLFGFVVVAAAGQSNVEPDGSSNNVRAVRFPPQNMAPGLEAGASEPGASDEAAGERVELRLASQSAPKMYTYRPFSKALDACRLLREPREAGKGHGDASDGMDFFTQGTGEEAEDGEEREGGAVGAVGDGVGADAGGLPGAVDMKDVNFLMLDEMFGLNRGGGDDEEDEDDDDDEEGDDEEDDEEDERLFDEVGIKEEVSALSKLAEVLDAEIAKYSPSAQALRRHGDSGHSGPGDVGSASKSASSSHPAPSVESQSLPPLGSPARNAFEVCSEEVRILDFYSAAASLAAALISTPRDQRLAAVQGAVAVPSTSHGVAGDLAGPSASADVEASTSPSPRPFIPVDPASLVATYLGIRFGVSDPSLATGT